MSDDPTLDPDDELMGAAKDAATVPSEAIPDADGLPDDVKDGDIADEAPDEPTLEKEV